MKSILIVEDMTGIAELLSQMLNSNDYVTTWAKDGKEAWAVLNGNLSFDIILSDKDMPVNGDSEAWSGVDLLARVRLDQKLRGTRFVLMSGDSGNHEYLQEVCAKLDAQFLQKPFTPPQLLEALRGG